MIFAAMFHHFHGSGHNPSQGSIDTGQFQKLIEVLSLKYKILSPDRYAEKILNDSISDKEICLSFDDALRSQYDVAVPILKKLEIKAFFFVYSSAFLSEPSTLEFYRDFRSSCYNNINTFYDDYFYLFKEYYADLYNSYERSYPKNYLSEFPFYTDLDRRFRYTRDIILLQNRYQKIMEGLMARNFYDISSRKEHLFMNEQILKNLSKSGHTIGLHSHSHPTKINVIGRSKQKIEYEKNLSYLESTLGKKIWSMSHPCGNYNEDTLLILKELGIKIGFRSSLSVKSIKSHLEIPREDHTNLVKKYFDNSTHF